MADFTIKQDDLEPGIFATITDSFDVAVDITEATGVLLRFSTLTRVELWSREVTVETASLGTVSYTWQDGDTATAGVYYAEFVVEWPGSRLQTYPPIGYLTVEIQPRL